MKQLSNKKTIHKKVWPEYFQAIVDGRKTFDLRLANFEVEEGDLLILEEWDPKTKEYTGHKIEKKVGYILKFKPSDYPFASAEDIEKNGLQAISLR